MHHDFVVLMSIGTMSFIASYLAFLPMPREEDAEVEDTPQLRVARPPQRGPLSAPTLECEDGQWWLCLPSPSDMPERSASGYTTVNDLRWMGRTALVRSRSRRWRVPEGKA